MLVGKEFELKRLASGPKVYNLLGKGFSLLVSI